MAYPNLIAEMKHQNIEPQNIARVIEQSTDTVNSWLQGKEDFPIGEAFKETKIEQLCHQMKDTDKQVNSATATTAAATAASVATTIASTAVQQVIAEQPADAQTK